MARWAAIFLGLACTVALADDHDIRTIAVSGFGSAEARPDRATLLLTIEARHPSVAAAQEEAAEVTARVLEIAGDMEIPDNRVDTMSASIRPDYRWNNETEKRELLGYVAQRQMRIEVHDLEKVGTVIERAVEAGVNQVSPPQLSSSKGRDAYRDALAAAAEDARQNAERLAGSLGMTLGDAVRVDAGSAPRPPVPLGRMEAMAADAAPQTYSAGDLTVTASISVVFEILP